MKIYWGLRRSHREVEEHIGELERELGIDNATLFAAPDPSKKKRIFKPPVLAKKEDWLHDWGRLDTKPGAVYPVQSHNFVQVCSSVASSQTMMSPPKSRVELPPGVALH